LFARPSTVGLSNLIPFRVEIGAIRLGPSFLIGFSASVNGTSKLKIL